MAPPTLGRSVQYMRTARAHAEAGRLAGVPTWYRLNGPRACNLSTALQQQLEHWLQMYRTVSCLERLNPSQLKARRHHDQIVVLYEQLEDSVCLFTWHERFAAVDTAADDADYVYEFPRIVSSAPLTAAQFAEGRRMGERSRPDAAFQEFMDQHFRAGSIDDVLSTRQV